MHANGALLLEPSGGFHRKLLLAHSIADISIDLEYHACKIIPRTFEGAVHCNGMPYSFPQQERHCEASWIKLCTLEQIRCCSHINSLPE